MPTTRPTPAQVLVCRFFGHDYGDADGFYCRRCGDFSAARMVDRVMQKHRHILTGRLASPTPPERRTRGAGGD